MKTKLSAVLLALALVGCGANGNTNGGDTPNTAEISVVTREEGSGTRTAFIELFKVEVKDDAGKKTDMTTAEAIVANKTDVMLTNVTSDPNAIGYVSLGSLNDDVKALKIDGVAPSVDNVKNGTYKIARPFNIVTNSGTELSEVADDFIKYILSTEGQAVVLEEGYIALDDTKAYTPTNLSGKIVIAGSSSVSPLMEVLAESYKAINKDVTIEIQTSDSGAGIKAATDGTAEIGMASRAVTDEEKANLNDIQIATDGIAVIVNKENSLSEATSELVRTIFTGEILTWDKASK